MTSRAVALAALASLAWSACGRSLPPPSPVPFEVAEKSIDELGAAMASGQTTSRALTTGYLDRIEAYDRRGPALAAMIIVNPNALAEADSLDRERRERGPRGPLHGIPIVLKDNYDTADMPTTAGSIALAGSRPVADGFQVRKLRAAGAVIVGKTNLHELARGITTISSLGGQTRNPYDPTRNPGGSSGGTGAAVAASFAAAGMGSDTCGSIRYPAAENSLVGLRPTLGLSSRGGIVPLSHSQDVGGPLARSVRDLALMLDATVGVDPDDETTARGVGHVPSSYAGLLDAGGMRGARIGVLEPLFGDAPEDQAVASLVRAGLAQASTLGAEMVEIGIPDLPAAIDAASVISFEFKFDLENYLRKTPGAPVKSLGEILDRGLYHAALEQVFRSSNAIESPDTPEYRAALARQAALRALTLKTLETNRLTALAYPTLRRTSARIREPQRGGNCGLSAATGLPAITVPAGFAPDGLPVGLELLGRPFAEPNLMRMAYAFEQSTHHRRPPAATPPLGQAVAPMVIDVKASGRDMVPPVPGPAGAVAQFSLDRATRQLRYRVDPFGMSDDAVLFTHVHRGAPGVNGPVIAILERQGAKAAGRVELSPAEASDLERGLLYVDVHTRRYPAGEVRGQLPSASPAVSTAVP